MAGDLYIRIKLKKHKIYERRGADLYTKKEITLLEALTGFKMQLDYLDGSKLLIATKPFEVISPSIIIY